MVMGLGGPISRRIISAAVDWTAADNDLLLGAMTKSGEFKVQDDLYFEPDYVSIDKDMTATDQLVMTLQHQVEKFMEPDFRKPMHVGRKLIKLSNTSRFWELLSQYKPQGFKTMYRSY